MKPTRRNTKVSSKQKAYNAAMEQLAKHRKKWLPESLKDRRYVRGTINAKIQEAINPRQTGDETTNEEVRAAVLQKCGNRCFYCHRGYTRDTILSRNMPELYFTQLEIDHIVPHSKRGPNAVSNYVAACRRCNQLKSNLTMAEFKVLLRADQRKRGY